MRGKQLAMDSMLEDIDRYQLAQEKRETDMIRARLDEKYEKMDYWKLRDGGYPAGSVVIIAQNLFRNHHYTWHFYRTVLNFYASCHDPHRAVFVEDVNDEFPERPPWADTVGHEGERKDSSGVHSGFDYWVTGEVVEPIETWWMKKWGCRA